MNLVTRLNKYKDESFDDIMLWIRNGSIKCGKHAHLVKIDKKYKINEKELFNNGKDKWRKDSEGIFGKD